MKLKKLQTTTDYDAFSKTFSNSRKSLKWGEIDYFIEKYLKIDNGKLITILDIGCGNGRLLSHFSENFDLKKINYIGTDSSSGMIKEAKKNYPNNNFLVLDMLESHHLEKNKFDFILFIASFHHLDSLEKREKVLENVKKLLKKDGIIFMANWSLESDLNREKYKKNKILKSENKFESSDFSIKIGTFNRFYHCFTILELDYLFSKTGFKILENREFENKKNFVSVLKN